MANSGTSRTARVFKKPLLRALQRSTTGLIGAIIVLLVVASALFPHLIAPTDPAAQDIGARLQPPASRLGNGRVFWLGSDGLGRDILSRVIFGARWALSIGILAVAIRGMLGTGFGLVSGYAGGWTDEAIMRVADIQQAVPFLVLALAIIFVLGSGFGNLVFALGVTGWVTYARIVRGEAMVLRNREFVEAARAIGSSTGRVLRWHLLPNLLPSVIVVASAEIGQVILAEASLSFLGLGLPASIPTWGTMVADGRDIVDVAWWVSAFPGLALFLTVLGFSLFGDWLREALDPTLRWEA